MGHPFLLRSVAPPPSVLGGKRVIEVRRLGKRIALGFEGDLWAVIHLMIAGRLHWRKADASIAAFAAVLTRRNHTLKRALTDPRLFSGIGNAYSDEILHAARLSPILQTLRVGDEAIARLYEAARRVLVEWTERLRDDAGDDFPEKVTAFRAEMAVHGRFGKPCPVCGSPVQRIRYATNETNYCVTCQTGGKVLADRGLSRLLKKDWPRTLEELEELRGPTDL